MLLNPVDVARVLVLTVARRVRRSSGYTGALFRRVFGTALGPAIAITALSRLGDACQYSSLAAVSCDATSDATRLITTSTGSQPMSIPMHRLIVPTVAALCLSVLTACGGGERPRTPPRAARRRPPRRPPGRHPGGRGRARITSSAA